MCIRDRYHVAEGPGFESPRAQNPKGGSCAFLSCHVAESAKKACELAKFGDNRRAVGMLHAVRDRSKGRASSGRRVCICDHGLSQEAVECIKLRPIERESRSNAEHKQVLEMLTQNRKTKTDAFRVNNKIRHDSL